MSLVQASVLILLYPINDSVWEGWHPVPHQGRISPLEEDAQKYPLPKVDLMYEPHKAGAMENQGLILFDGRALLIGPERTDDDFRCSTSLPISQLWARMYVKDTQRVMSPNENVDLQWAMTDPMADLAWL